MHTINISLPASLKTFIDEQVADGGFGSSSDYVRDLLRREADRQTLRALLLDGAKSGRAETVSPAFFDRLRNRIGE